jgi:hypothetical protein
MRTLHQVINRFSITPTLHKTQNYISFYSRQFLFPKKYFVHNLKLTNIKTVLCCAHTSRFATPIPEIMSSKKISYTNGPSFHRWWAIDVLRCAKKNCLLLWNSKDGNAGDDFSWFTATTGSSCFMSYLFLISAYFRKKNQWFTCHWIHQVHYVYGFYDSKSGAEADEYRSRFLNRRIREVFSETCRRWQRGQFHIYNTKASAVKENTLDLAQRRPMTGVPKMSHRLGESASLAWRTTHDERFLSSSLATCAGSSYRPTTTFVFNFARSC